MTCMCVCMFSCVAELAALSPRSVPHDPTTKQNNKTQLNLSGEGAVGAQRIHLHQKNGKPSNMLQHIPSRFPGCGIFSFFWWHASVVMVKVPSCVSVWMVEEKQRKSLAFSGTRMCHRQHCTPLKGSQEKPTVLLDVCVSS